MSRTNCAVAAHACARGVQQFGVDQRHPSAVDAGDGLHRELGDVMEQIQHSAAACHDLGDTAEAEIQIDLVGFQLCW